MSYIEKTLVSNEKIEYLFKLSWVNYVSIFMYITIFYGLSFLSIKYGFGYWLKKDLTMEAFLSIIGIIILAIPFFIPLKSIEQGVTNRRLIFKKGIFARTTNEIRLEAIQTIEIEQTLLGRLLNYGNVHITGRGNGEIIFEKVNDPINVKKYIEETAEKREVFLSNRGEIEI